MHDLMCRAAYIESYNGESTLGNPCAMSCEPAGWSVCVLLLSAVGMT